MMKIAEAISVYKARPLLLQALPPNRYIHEFIHSFINFTDKIILAMTQGKSTFRLLRRVVKRFIMRANLRVTACITRPRLKRLLRPQT